MASLPHENREATFQMDLRVYPPKTNFSPVEDEQVAVIRKELVALTGDPFSAVILNQLLYWTLRVKDFDLFLEEEKTLGSHTQDPFIRPESHEPFCHGWIYKTAHDLIEETLLGISHPTMRKYLKLLVDRGWIDERANPLDKWNKTTQYRVNIRTLQADLMAIGRHLPSLYLKAFSAALLEKQPHKYLKAVSLNDDASSIENREFAENLISLQSTVRNFPSDENLSTSSLKSAPKSEEISNVRILHSDVRNLQSNVRNFPSNVKNLHSYTYTETTPKTTNKDHTQRTRARADFDKNFCEKNFSEKDFFAEILRIWNTCINQEAHLTEERKQRLQSVLSAYFQNDLSQWKRFCERVGCSPFLMGHGARKWRISLDWVLCEENLIKVLEGNFDDPKALEQKQAEQSKTDRAKEISAILASISDPVWKKWCSQLDFSTESRDSVSLWELKEIAHARFLEVEDDRLVWIGSSDRKALSRIEDLQWKILPFVQRIFPQARTLRTRLEEKSTPHQPKIPDSNTIPTKTTQLIGEHYAQ